MERSDAMNRRRALQLLGGGAGLLVLAACGSNGSSESSATTTTAGGTTDTTAAAAGAADCPAPVPQETAGPFPGDGSNGPDILSQDGVVRSDIRSSFGSYSGTAEGVPLEVKLSVLDAAACVPLTGAAVYIWHCDREGRYSMYESASDANYLRGVQAVGADGTVTFQSIYPGAYSGRWPHIHFEIYSSVDDATSGGNPVATSQLAFPQDVCEVAYTADGYEASISNLARTSLDSDMVFSDGVDQQLATVEGSVEGGYTATLSLSV